jgi:outer membrane protein TolC
MISGSIVSAQVAGAPAPLVLTLTDALARARSNSVAFQAALTDQGIAQNDRVQAGAALLPSVTYNNTFTYTQGNGTTVGRFIANNGVHEYLSQGNVHQAVGVSLVADYRRAGALASLARAKAEIAGRGLVVAVVQNFYGLIDTQSKYANVQRASAEAERFLQLSQKLENGGEVAHSDVIKAQIQYDDRQRDLREAKLAMDRSRLDLAVLLFPDFNENFTVVDEAQVPPLMSFEEFVHAAESKNPEVRAATAALQASRYEHSSARGGYLPTLLLDYFYGIDAKNFATHFINTDPSIGPVGVKLPNLGYSVVATLNIPIWNWGATHSKVVQADLRQKLAARELSLAQRKLLADMRSLYGEAEASRSELELLQSSADLAAESLRLVNLRYQAGEATVLEVVDAQNTLTQARNAYSDGQLRYRNALANLQTLTGTM